MPTTLAYADSCLMRSFTDPQIGMRGCRGMISMVPWWRRERNVRQDMSSDLVHWMKGVTNEEAAQTLLKIVSERRLNGGEGHILGRYTCVCFTEAPLRFFHEKLGKYRPFGIKFTKQQIYAWGGRPVIYQSKPEIDTLSADIMWRHVTYDPNVTGFVDFTWEREWRIHTDFLDLSEEFATVVAPTRVWADWLVNSFQDMEDSFAHYQNAMLGEPYYMPNEFPFKIEVLEDLPH